MEMVGESCERALPLQCDCLTVWVLWVLLGLWGADHLVLQHVDSVEGEGRGDHEWPERLDDRGWVTEQGT